MRRVRDFAEDGLQALRPLQDCGVEAVGDRSHRTHRQANRLPPPIDATIVRLKGGVSGLGRAQDRRGSSSKDLAERYHVSRAWVDALKQRRRETGAFAPLKPTKFRGRALAARDLDRLPAVMAAQPDATLEEIRQALRTSAGLTTIWRARNQLDFTLKKNGPRRRTVTARRRR